MKLFPVPVDSLLGMYHPWRDVIWDKFTAGVPFKNFLITDPFRQQFPWKWLTIDILKKGQLPLWNPYSFSGTPLLANFQSSPFYIFNFLFFIFPFNFAWALFIYLQPLLAALFFYLYTKNLKLKKWACIFGSLIWAFSGFFLAWFQWGIIGHTVLWLPLILLSIDKVFFTNLEFRNAKCKMQNVKLQLKMKNLSIWSGIFIFSLSQSFFAGHLQIAAYVILFSIIYLFTKLFYRKICNFKLFFLFFIFYFLFFIITSLQWLPAIQFIKLSARAVDQSWWQNPGWFIPWQNLIQFFAPDFFGNPATLNYWGIWNYGEFIGYIGVLPLTMALFAIFNRRDKKTLFFIGILLASFLFVLPTPMAKLPYKWQIPFLSTSQPTRLLAAINFCLAMLVALGIDYFLRKKTLMIHIIRVLVFISIFYSSLWIFVLLSSKIWPNGWWIKHLPVAKRNLILPTLLTLFTCSLIHLFTKNKNIRWIKFIIITLFLSVIFDLGRFWWKFTPFVKEDWIFPKTKTIEFLQKNIGYYRFMAIDRKIMPPNTSIMYKLQDISGYDPLYLKDYARLITQMETGQSNQLIAFNRIIQPENYESEIADLLGVKYVLSLTDLKSPKLKKVFQEGETRIYENLQVKPRVFFENSQIKANIIAYSENEILIKAVNDSNGKLILTDMFYPLWKAEIDGQLTKVFKTDYGFRSIIVPKGSHQIKFYLR